MILFGPQNLYSQFTSNGKLTIKWKYPNKRINDESPMLVETTGNRLFFTYRGAPGNVMTGEEPVFNQDGTCIDYLTGEKYFDSKGQFRCSFVLNGDFYVQTEHEVPSLFLPEIRIHKVDDKGNLINVDLEDEFWHLRTNPDSLILSKNKSTSECCLVFSENLSCPKIPISFFPANVWINDSKLFCLETGRKDKENLVHITTIESNSSEREWDKIAIGKETLIGVTQNLMVLESIDTSLSNKYHYRLTDFNLKTVSKWDGDTSSFLMTKDFFIFGKQIKNTQNLSCISLKDGSLLWEAETKSIHKTFSKQIAGNDTHVITLEQDCYDPQKPYGQKINTYLIVRSIEDGSEIQALKVQKSTMLLGFIDQMLIIKHNGGLVAYQFD